MDSIEYDDDITTADQTLVCVDCDETFTFSVRQQARFADKGFRAKRDDDGMFQS